MVLVAAAGSVLALPPADLVLGGVATPSSWLIAAAVLALSAVLIGSSLAGVAGMSGPALLTLALSAGFVAAVVSASAGPPAAVKTVSAICAFAAVPALVQLTVAWPRGWPTSRAKQIIAVAAWSIPIVGVAWALVWDPFSDATCVLGCGDNPMVVRPDAAAARGLASLGLAISLVTAAAAAAFALRPRRFWPGGIATLALAVDAGVRLSDGARLVESEATLLFGLRCTSMVLVGAALAAVASSRLRMRARLRALTASLERLPPNGMYAASLGDALGDRSLAIAYAIAGEERYAHADGRPFTPPGADRVVTRLMRDGQPVAVIVHRPEHASSISSGLGAAARLLIDNERLQAELRAGLADLRESRERLVERADAERLRLERDLHDGAQQRLLMLGHELRCAADTETSSQLKGTVDDAEMALQELREIAHGIYPGLLESLGLPAALDALSDGPAWFELEAATTRRLPAVVERAAYRIVNTVLDALPSVDLAHPPKVTATTMVENDRLLLRVNGFGSLEPRAIDELQDHVKAIGGRLCVTPGSLTCQLPCA